jgi:hypothetical protein
MYISEKVFIIWLLSNVIDLVTFIFAIPLILRLPNLTFLLLLVHVINTGCIVSGQADNAEFKISLSAETAEEGGKKGIRFWMKPISSFY